MVRSTIPSQVLKIVKKHDKKFVEFQLARTMVCATDWGQW